MRTMRTCKLPEKRCQKLKAVSRDVNPETALEYFQISVNVLEARKLAWASPSSTNSYVVVMLGKDKHRTSIKKNAAEPCFREYFLFEWYATIREVQHTSLWLAVMEPKCCAPPRLLGETSIDLTAIWEQPNHQVFHKWAQLSLPREPEAGAVGFLKVDISIVCREDVQAMPATVTQDITKGPISTGLVCSEQQTANYMITVFGAFGVPGGTQGQGDRRYGKPPSTYVKVSFCGLSGKTAVQYRNYNPTYSEQISIVEAFPNICQLIRLEVCSAEVCFNNVLASADLRLRLISHDGEQGFVPTFGPSLLQMYGNGPSSLGTSGENGSYYKGALLVALKTVVPYYQQGLRSTNVEPVTPMHMDDIWTWENFSIFCPILEVSMLDKHIISNYTGVALTIGEIPCARQSDREFILMANEIKTRKLHYTGSLEVTATSSAYGHIDFSSTYPVLQLATCLPDFRFRMFINNMIRVIASNLENSVNTIEEKFTKAKFAIFNGLVDELNDAIDNAGANLRKFLDIEDFTHQSCGSEGDIKYYETELDQKQLALQKEELKKIYHRITKKNRCNSTINLKGLFSQTSRDSYAVVNKKEVKSLMAEAKTLVEKINSLVFTSPDGWPDVVIWLLNDVSRVAYYKMPLRDVIFSEMPDQCGRHCGRIQTVYLKPLICSKHMNTLTTGCTCVAGRIEILVWMGPYLQKDMFYCCLPKAYKLKTKEFDMCLKTTTMMLQCRVYINRAKLNVYPESGSLPCPFVRINALNSVKETKVESHTVTPSWNVVLKTQSLTFISQSRLSVSPPTILIEVFDNDISAKTDFIGRVEIQPAVENRPQYQYAPKLQWHNIHRGLDKTGDILMSAQLLQIPETLVKSTIYTVDDTCNEASNKENTEGCGVMEELPPCLMPKSNTYKVDIYWWGLRDVSVTRKPCAVLEIDEMSVKSDIITEGKPNCNFPTGRSSRIFEAPLNEPYCPPLIIKICDSSTFGRTLFMGTNVVKNPNKYLVDWLPKYAREATLKSVSIMSSNFLRVSETMFIKKKTSSEVSTEYSKMTISSSILQTRKKKPAWKRLFCREETSEEEFVLLPVFAKKESYNLGTKVPVPETLDWWLLFFDSVKIYHSELENQPEFDKFKDWCKTLKLYCGKKSGIAERDAKLQCGFMKVGIAIYNWPPPSDTVAVTSSGVDLLQGYFDDHPLNEPTNFLVRVYIVRGLNLMARSFTGQCDPYVVINCGSKHSEDNNRNNRSLANTSNSVFGKMYEFQCCLPEDYLLTVSIYNREALSPDDLIGSTFIDLEDRIYSKHKARVGLATNYNTSGLAKWRDCVKPSVILEELCLQNHIPAPIYLDNNTVIVNEVQYVDTDQTNQTYISASERKENLCLELLHKWQTLPLCGYQLVPEHVETRSLLNPDKRGVEQGKIQMWVDIFPLDTGKHIPLPVDIAPRKVENYELRLTVWSVQGVPAIFNSENKRKDVYVKAWIGTADQAQYTDINYQCMNGEAVFNWRMIFHFQYQHAERAMILKEKGPYTEVEEHLPPVLVLQVIDSYVVSNDECLGTIMLDLNSFPRGSKSKECKLHALDFSKRVNLFSIRSIRGWWPLKRVDINTGSADFSGMIDLELSLMPKEMAIIMPAGLGRDPPFPLQEPSRPESYHGTEKSSLLKSIFSSGGTEYVVIGMIILVTFVAAFYWEFPSFLFGTLLG